MKNKFKKKTAKKYEQPTETQKHLGGSREEIRENKENLVSKILESESKKEESTEIKVNNFKSV